MRLSLSVPTVGPLLDEKEQRRVPDQTRAEFLRTAFTERRDFFHRGKLFTYVPAPHETQQKDTVLGYFGKKFSQTVNDGPENLYRTKKTEFYRASVVAIDLRPDRQIVAFERRSDLGEATALLESFFSDFIRTSMTLSWHVDCEFISEERDFWTAVEHHRGEITEVSFEFYPANGVTGFDSFKKFDKVAKETSNAESSKYSLVNSDGNLVPKGEIVESAVEYAHEGPGRVQLKSGRRVLYNSQKSKISREIPEEVMPREVEVTKLLGLAILLFSGLKR